MSEKKYTLEPAPDGWVNLTRGDGFVLLQVDARDNALTVDLLRSTPGERRGPRGRAAAGTRTHEGEVMGAEEWRVVPGTECLYEVSSLGRVRSRRRRGTKGGIVAQHPGPGGYPRVYLYLSDRTLARPIHWLLMSAFVGPRPEGLVTRHLDGDPTNNDLSNLTYGTQAENRLDQIEHGTNTSGERNGRARLTAGEVVEIRRLHAAGIQQKELAAKYGVAKETVSLIVRRVTWAHLLNEGAAA